nr:HAD hydrolase-like protein [Candidatus Njordarchaeota archaeon]
MSKDRPEEYAVIFDFDGTLLDSYAPRKGAHKKVCEFLLANLSRQGYSSNQKRMLGIISSLDKEMHKNRVYDRNLWWKEAIKRYTDKTVQISDSTFTEASVIYWETVKEGSFLYRGVRSMLSILKQEGIELGLVSDTDGLRGMKTRRIEDSGLRKFFDAIVVGGEDTAEVKPHCEPFALVSKMLKVTPTNCVSVGDNVETDVDGGLELGMQVVIIRNKNASQECKPSHYHFVKRSELTRFIINLIKEKSAGR